MKDFKLLIILLLVLVSLIFIASPRSGNWLQKLSKNQTASQSTNQILVGNTPIFVRVVRTSQERANGLSGVESIADNEGMLFLFDQKNVKPGFWMKGMKFAIDIIWIKDNKVAQITPDLKPAQEGLADSKIPVFYPDQPIDYVVEVKSGFAEKNNIKVGDSVDFGKVLQ